ncbi:acyl-CoA dehydrogenase [Solihabitans fulvus]|uniref:Acyl-CoA dehydrogenase n=1 Tax=Solihabitans fulvus TaxID=1892852 RepID=A0A5B2WXF5_9PSEU|nr:acyl-CoA dehydrogenase family protein [Solihabitans fulvus]KAA2255362.1 acyl-CoA dehydrogenase [Solihabitans fulvus]
MTAISDPSPAVTDFRRALVDALDTVGDATGRELWCALGRGGVLAAHTAGEDPRADRLRALLTELDARYPLGVVLSVCVQVATALPILLHGPASEHVAGVGAAALRGEAMLALAATDSAASGSDLMDLGTTAVLGEDTVVLDGGKRWITNAGTADHLLVLARHRPQRHFTSFLWVLVPADAPGLTVEPADGSMFAGSGVGHLSFDAVTLGRDHLVGAPGRGLATFSRHIATERLAGGLWAGAMCRRVLTDTRRALADKPLHGATAWDNDAVRQRFARCLVESRRIDALCADVCGGSGGLVDSMVLKASVADSLDRVLGECVQLIGADAFGAGGVARLRAEAAMFGVAGGATGAMLAGVADHADDLLGGPR